MQQGCRGVLMKCTDLLIQDHKIILRALDVLQAMATRTELGEPVEPEDVAALVSFLRTFADDYHQTKEETSFFPALEHTEGIRYEALRHMVFEHNQERSLVEGIEEAVCTKKGEEFIYFANLLIQFLRTHIQKEENVMFEFAARGLSQEKDEQIAEEIEKFECNPACLAELRRLEWAYLRRQAHLRRA
jgi:hemerythrin-like domain-containing protein